MTLSKNNRIENKSGQTPKCLVARLVNAFKSVVADVEAHSRVLEWGASTNVG